METISKRMQFFGRLNPAIFDVINQISFRLSEGTRQVMSGMVIKSIAMETENTKVRADLNEIGKSLFTNGVKAMSYEDDEWYHCGTPYTHFHIPHHNDMSEIEFRESLTEERHLNSMGNYSTALNSLANAIKSAETAARLRTIANSFNQQNSKQSKA